MIDRSFWMLTCLLLLVAAIPGRLRADDISPARPVRLGELPAEAEIVFVRSSTGEVNRPNLADNVFVMSASGSGVTQLTFNKRPVRYEHAVISPDRRYLALNYHVRGSGRRPSSLLWVLDFEAGTEAQLVPDFISAGSGGIDWDLEGRLYFAAESERPRRGDGRDVYRIRADGTDLERLTETPEGEADVAVSEDGRFVTFVRAVMQPPRGGHTELWAMQSDGTDPRRVYTSGRIRVESAHDPEFSPDAKALVFSQVNPRHRNFRRSFDTAHDIFTIGIDGTARTRLTPEGGIQIIPDWLAGRVLYTEYNEAEDYTGLAILELSSRDRVRIGPSGARAGKWIAPLQPRQAKGAGQ